MGFRGLGGYIHPGVLEVILSSGRKGGNNLVQAFHMWSKHSDTKLSLLPIGFLPKQYTMSSMSFKWLRCRWGWSEVLCLKLHWLVSIAQDWTGLLQKPSALLTSHDMSMSFTNNTPLETPACKPKAGLPDLLCQYPTLIRWVSYLGFACLLHA